MASTKQPELSLQRFEVLIEAYGSDLEHFPEHERTAAKALVLRMPEARRLLEKSRALDALLLHARQEEHDYVELERRLLRIPDEHAQERPMVLLLPFRSRARAGLAAAAAVAFGLFSGELLPRTPQSESVRAALEVDAKGGELDETETLERAELVSLTFADDLFAELTEEEGGTD